ncbi:protein GbcA [Pseudomonas citronellolis]|nr:protein GbcA [Pseudomonas citronellolis]
MGPIVRTPRAPHLPASDICMLIATCRLGRGLPGRKRMWSCRPWIRHRKGPDAHCPQPKRR